MKIQQPTSCPFFGALGKIYTLADTKGNIFYVGCTTQGMEKRLLNHIQESKKKTSPDFKGKTTMKCKKIAELEFEITATILEIKWVTGPNVYDAGLKLRKVEFEYIKRYLRLGYQLTNKEINKIELPVVPIEFVGQSFQAVANKITVDTPCQKDLIIIDQK